MDGYSSTGQRRYCDMMLCMPDRRPELMPILLVYWLDPLVQAPASAPSSGWRVGSARDRLNPTFCDGHPHLPLSKAKLLLLC